MGAGAGGAREAWMRGGVRISSGMFKIQLPNGKVIRSDSSERRPVGDGEPHHSYDKV